MTPADIDRLAAFCKLADKGYRRDPECGVLCEPEWVRDVPGGVEIWRPDESDDDCRVVLERFYAVATDEQAVAFHEAVAYVYWPGLVRYVKRIVLASPREKCEAVAKVMGWE